MHVLPCQPKDVRKGASLKGEANVNLVKEARCVASGNSFGGPKRPPNPTPFSRRGGGPLDERINSLIDESEDLRMRIAEKRSAKRPQDL